MKVDVNEISALIREQIKEHENVIHNEDVGMVLSVGDGIALVYGLDDVMLNELVSFENGSYGLVLNLQEEYVGIVVLGDDLTIKEGDKVKRTGRLIEVGVGDNFLGRVVDALGRPIDGKGEIRFSKRRTIERIAPGVMMRSSINEPLETGIKAIDAMIPIGKGQRELIIGDRQTGKTAIAIDTIINQRDKNVFCVYVAIGQKQSTVANIVEKLKFSNALNYTVVVSASASENAAMQYIAPYSATAIAEEWLENGKDVLIVYDDLSKHAVSYRTLSLLLKRPPGREAYPGDVFYLHSRLLERAGKLSKQFGGGTLTALPIIETQAGDISAYIPTNVISITDGQIFLLSNLFNEGFRPAIDSGLSVSRVGGSAQTRAMKQVASSLKISLANYHELKDFSRFGSDLDPHTKAILKHGDVLMELFKQDQYFPFAMERQILELFAVNNGFLDSLDMKDVTPFLDGLYEYVHNFYPHILEELKDKKEISDALKQNMMDAISDYKEVVFRGEEILV